MASGMAAHSDGHWVDQLVETKAVCWADWTAERTVHQTVRQSAVQMDYLKVATKAEHWAGLTALLWVASTVGWKAFQSVDWLAVAKVGSLAAQSACMLVGKWGGLLETRLGRSLVQRRDPR